MKYTSEFYSINQTLYKIEIDVVNKSGSDKTFKLSENPFIATIASEDKHIYAPIRCGGATVGVLTDSFIPDFYNGQSKGVKVTLLNESNSNKVEWVGYVTPSVYSQGFDEYLEELEIDCVDGIAVLKDILYTPNGDETEIKTFANVIHKCLKESGCYSNFYISDNVQFTSTGTESIIDKLRISEAAFMDKRDDANQTIDDVAWSCYDVLYQILQFLGYTLIVEGDEVYIIDYDAIKSGNNRYYKYSLSTSTVGTPTAVNVSYSKYIDGVDYAQNGTTIEMSEVFNKVTVKDEFNLYDSVFPAYDDINFQTNITPSADTLSSKDNLVFSTICYEERNGKKDYFYFLVFSGWRNKYFALVLRFYDNALFTMHRYTKNNATITNVTNSSIWNGQCKIGDMLDYNGGFYYRYYKKIIDYATFARFYVAYSSSNKSNDTTIRLFKEMCGENSFQLSPITVFKNGGTGRIKPGVGVEGNLNQKVGLSYGSSMTCVYPMMTLKDSMGSKVFGGDNAQIRIVGSWLHHDEDSTPFPLSDGADNGKLKREGDLKDADEGWFWAKLRWGNNWWNGTTWLQSEAYFPIYYWTTKRPREDRKNKNIFDKWFRFCDPNSPKDEPMDYIIPCPSGYNLQGNVSMSLYTRDMHGDSRRSHWHPKGNSSDNFYCRYYTKVMCLKDFDVIPEIGGDIVDDGAGETDTVYTNVITNGSVNAMDEVTFKVCTDDNKKPNYSVVDYLDSSNKSQYVKTLYNKALRTKESGSAGCDGKTDGGLRQEEHYIFKLATQYENPMLVFECNLKNNGHKMYGTYTDKTLSGKTFIVGERDIDYKYDTVRLQMTEKF